MTREEALKLLKEHLKNRNLFNHCLAVEAVMRALARRLGADEDTWAKAGLLHDIDYESTKDDAAKHSLIGADMLAEAGLPEEVVQAVRVHNEYHGLERVSLMDKALYAADPLTGLIVACALIHPEKKLAPIDVSFVTKRFYEKAFARGASREQIATCTELDLTLEEFLGLGLSAMQEIAGSIGL